MIFFFQMKPAYANLVMTYHEIQGYAIIKNSDIQFSSQ